MDLDSRTSPGHEQSHAPTSPTRRSCSWPSRGPHHCNIRQPHAVEKNDDGRLETSYRFVDFSYMLRALKRLQTPSLVLPFLDGLITRGWVVCTLFPLICWIWLSALADAREARLCRKRFVLARWTQALYVALAWLPLSTSRQATGIYHDHSDTRCHRRHEGHHLGRALRVCIDASVRFGLIHSSMHPGTGFLHPGRSTMRVLSDRGTMLPCSRASQSRRHWTHPLDDITSPRLCLKLLCRLAFSMAIRRPPLAAYSLAQQRQSLFTAFEAMYGSFRVRLGGTGMTSRTALDFRPSPDLWNRDKWRSSFSHQCIDPKSYKLDSARQMRMGLPTSTRLLSR